jgi:hypothetical protein
MLGPFLRPPSCEQQGNENARNAQEKLSNEWKQQSAALGQETCGLWPGQDVEEVGKVVGPKPDCIAPANGLDLAFHRQQVRLNVQSRIRKYEREPQFAKAA